jgi:hypothetical protein
VRITSPPPDAVPLEVSSLRADASIDGVPSRSGGVR